MVVEVEAKFQVEDLTELEYKLVEKKAMLKEVVKQRDLYFSHPNKDFSKTDEAIRIRQAGEDSYLTYKGPKFDRKSKTRIEVQVGVDSNENMIQILEMLGFTKEFIVLKERKVYEYKEFIFCLDQVDSLGSFLEIEKEVDSMLSYEEVQDRLFKIALSFGFEPKDSIRKSYLELLLEKK